MIDYCGVVNIVCDINVCFNVEVWDCVLVVLLLSFDFFVYDIFGLLVVGVVVVMFVVFV